MAAGHYEGKARSHNTHDVIRQINSDV